MKQLSEHISEALKINSKSKVNHYEKFTNLMIKQLKDYGSEEWASISEPWRDQDITRNDLEKFARRILNYHSSSLFSDSYNRLHNYVDDHIEDEELEKILTEIINDN